MGSAGREPPTGVLKQVDLRTGAVTPLYPAASSGRGRPDRGDPACPGEIGAVLLPHGLHLAKRRDGAWQLLAVNHGGRESVEFFELTGSEGRRSLRWRGCVVAPASSHFNDVAALPGGGFVVTTMDMGSNAETRSAGPKAARGENTGFPWRRAAGRGISRQARQPDAMRRCPTAYRWTRPVAMPSSPRPARAATSARSICPVALSWAAPVVPNPDNASWMADGRLLFAGVAAGPKPTACLTRPEAPCPAASAVYALDPATMAVERLVAHAGPPLDAATVAVQAGGDLLIGRCFGDSIVAVRNSSGRNRRRGAEPSVAGGWRRTGRRGR